MIFHIFTDNAALDEYSFRRLLVRLSILSSWSSHKPGNSVPHWRVASKVTCSSQFESVRGKVLLNERRGLHFVTYTLLNVLSEKWTNFFFFIHCLNVTSKFSASLLPSCCPLANLNVMVQKCFSIYNRIWVSLCSFQQIYQNRIQMEFSLDTKPREHDQSFLVNIR